MEIINELRQKQIVKKIKISNFIKKYELDKNPHSLDNFNKFIKKYDIDYAILNFKRNINKPNYNYQDHQRVFYSIKNNEIIVTVQPYIDCNDLLCIGWEEDNLSWHYPRKTRLYILKIKQKEKIKNSIEIPMYEVSHIIKKNDAWLVCTKDKKIWVCEVNGIHYNKPFYLLKLIQKGKCDK